MKVGNLDMEATASNQRRYLASAAIVLAIAAGAYAVGRVYPPLGPSAGTIAPADRYVSSQVAAGDVALGDTSIPQLMQTDAFEVLTKNPEFRAMASDPGFAALLNNGPAMAAVAANPGAFQAVSKDPRAFAEMAKVAAVAQAQMKDMAPRNAAMYAAIAGHAQTFSYMADRHPQALSQMLSRAADLGALSKGGRPVLGVGDEEIGGLAGTSTRGLGRTTGVALLSIFFADAAPSSFFGFSFS